MAVRIKFDKNHNAIQPTLVLAQKSGNKLGSIPSHNIVFKDGMNECSEMSFSVNKVDCTSNEHLGVKFWKQIADFKLLWVPEWDKWFEIYVDLDEANDPVKNVTAKALGEAELSQINLYNIEINTEDDILRDDYEPTVLFDRENPNASLLTRITSKAPHYTIGHIDTSIANIQRSFSFDKKSIYDSLNEIAEEINCLFIVDCHSDSYGSIVREINAYDLESYCLACGERGEFIDHCDKCGSKHIKPGYGEDTAILVSTENLANNIQYTTDSDSVKNCFKLEAGDDLMTAAVINCNPNGSDYIWYISDKSKEEMSPALVDAIEKYNKSFEFYQKDYRVDIPQDTIDAYNAIIEKYKVYNEKLGNIPSSIVGYPALMEAYYNAIDFNMYLSHELMPSFEMQETTAKTEIAKLTADNLSPVAVKSLESCSASTAESSVLSVAKAIVDDRYQVKIKDTTFEDNTWNGIFIVTSYSNEDDTATSEIISCEINEDYEQFVKQKIDKILKKESSDTDIVDIVDLFKLDDDRFKDELKKYGLSSLKLLYDTCQSCLDILIEQGIANDTAAQERATDLYDKLYIPYYNKLGYIEAEIKVRDNEIACITGSYNKDGELISDGIQTLLESEKKKIQKRLDFERFLDTKLWREFCSFRREDTYSNSNYISDGLDNAELFKMALEFVENAQKEIFKSATLQHSISATLKNLLVIKEFEPILDKFEIGNWIRIRADGNIYKLRLIGYEIDYDNLSDIKVEFSDVKMVANGTSDVESILSQASSMATSYGSVSRQAKQGGNSKSQIDDWSSSGFSLSKIKIVDDANNQNISWDNHGLLCKEYLPDDNTYDEKQLKLINRGLYLTTDNWRTSRSGIGDFTYWNPITKQREQAYGVVADAIVGNIVLSENVGIYNENNSITLDKRGLNITVDGSAPTESQEAITICRKDYDSDGMEHIKRVMYVDSYGNIVLSGSIRIETERDILTLDEVSDLDTNKNNAVQDVENIILGKNRDGIIYRELNDLSAKLTKNIEDSIEHTDNVISKHTENIASYISFGQDSIEVKTDTVYTNNTTVRENLFLDGSASIKVDESYVSLVDYIKGVVAGTYT